MDADETRLFGRALGAVARAQAALDPESQARLQAMPMRRALDLIDAIPSGADFTFTTPELDALDAGLLVEGEEEWVGRYWNLVLLHLVARTLQRGWSYALPPALHGMVIGELERIVADCEEGRARDHGLGDHGLLLDLGFSRGSIIPFGISIGVAPSWLPPVSGPDEPHDERPWVHSHVDDRHTAEAMNEKGYTDGIALFAQFLRVNPDYGGFFGSGWLGDPRVGEVSPHLAFIRQRLEAGGATIVALGKTDDDTIEQATSTSRQRRRHFEEGNWTPSDYGVLWKRESFLRWAESQGI